MSTDPNEGDWQRAGDELAAAQTHRALASGDLVSSWALDEFFEALGPVMRLPPKEKEPKPADNRAVVPKGSRRPRVLIAAAMTLLTLAAFQAPLLRLLSRDVPVPDELLGAWSSATPRYADRGFALTSDTVRLQLGPGKTVSYPIAGVRRIGTADSARFTVRYRDGESVVEMGLRIEADATLRLVNLPSVTWRQEGH